MDSGLDPGVTILSTKKRYNPDSNVVFYLYREATVYIIKFMIFTIVVFQSCDFGSMKCYRGGECGCDDKFLSTYCWIQGTHTVLRHLNRTVGKEVPYPGIGQITSEDDIIQHSYYIWIYPWLALTIVLFKLPWWMWNKHWGGNRIKVFMVELDVIVVDDPDKVNTKKDRILAYFCAKVNAPIHTSLAIRYIFCEIINLLHVLGQMTFTDYLLNGGFSTYGLEVISFLRASQESRIDPMARIFPKVTACLLNLIGPSGNEQLLEGICVLPLNSLFEKLFVFLWFWFMMLAIVSIIGLIYRILTIYVPHFRYLLLRIQNFGCSPTALQAVCKRSAYGDWLLLFTLKNVIDCVFYGEVLEALGNKWKNEDEYKKKINK